MKQRLPLRRSLTREDEMTGYSREESSYFYVAGWGASLLGAAATTARIELLAAGFIVAVLAMLWKREALQRSAYLKYCALCVGAGLVCFVGQKAGWMGLGGAVMMLMVFLGFAAWWFWRQLKTPERATS